MAAVEPPRNKRQLLSDASVVPSNSRSRKRMQGVANVSFLAMFLMYLLAALFGYLTFNGEPHQPTGAQTPALLANRSGGARA